MRTEILKVKNIYPWNQIGNMALMIKTKVLDEINNDYFDIETLIWYDGQIDHFNF